ncbi:capping protein, Arp2/3 and myosin-I linker protein 2-like [Discoglossus pictus]
MLRSIRPTPVPKRACELDALVQDTEAVAGQMLLLPYSSSSPFKPLPVSIKDAELGGDCCCRPLSSSQPACSLHLMDLPTQGEKLQHYTRQRPRPNRTSRQPTRRAHVHPPENEISENNERDAFTKVDEGVEEFFCKKLIQEYHQTPLQVTLEPTTLTSSGSKTFKKKIGDFFALRKPRSTKSLKCEKDQDGGPLAPKSRKQTLTDILRPLGKGGETVKSHDKVEDDTPADGKTMLDSTWTPDAARRIKPRYSREGKSQSLILLSGDDDEALGIKHEKKRHCEKVDGEVCNTFEHRVHSMLHRIGVTRVLSSEVKKKQNKDGEIKKAGSEGDIVDSSAESPPPALKVRTHSMSTAERVTPKIAEPVKTPAEERLNWKDLSKQLNAELKGRCLELHSSPRRSLVILEHSESVFERKPEDSWSLPGLERSSPAPSPSRIIHLEDTSKSKDMSSEVFGNDEHLLKPQLRLKQFQNRRAVSAHEEQLRNQGFTSELESVKIPLARLQRSPVMKIKQRIEASSLQTSSDTKIVIETLASETCDQGKRPTPTESPLAIKSEGNETQTLVETAQNTAIDQRTETPSSHPPTENNQ